MAKCQKPTISADAFAAQWPALREALRKWVEQECLSFDEAVSDSAGASVFDGLPVIDSKTVVRASPIFKPIIGCELDVRWIRRGGYSSFDELADDLMAKIEKACVANADNEKEDATLAQPAAVLAARDDYE
jgi:hypothetical protein